MMGRGAEGPPEPNLGRSEEMLPVGLQTCRVQGANNSRPIPRPPGSARVTQVLHADPIVSAAPRSFGLQSTEGFLALGPLCMTLPWGTYVVHICPNPQGARLQE